MQLNKEATKLFFDLETKLHQKDVRNNSDIVSELLADEFIEFGSSGLVYNKAITLESLKEEQSDLQITVEDFKAVELSPQIVQVTYKTSKLDLKDNTKFQSLRSSIWIQVDGKWKMFFHQGTKIKTS